MKDTNGDDKADVNETWYTGFAEGNQQLRANHPTLALDNHIYIANGLRGGTIVDAQHPDVEAGFDQRHGFSLRSAHAQVRSRLRRRPVRPDVRRLRQSLRVLESQPGDPRRAGRPLPQEESARRGRRPSSTHVVPRRRLDSRSFRSAERGPRRTCTPASSRPRAACAVYRGDALPAEYYGNIFACEPTGHLVHREIDEAERRRRFAAKPVRPSAKSSSPRATSGAGR